LNFRRLLSIHSVDLREAFAECGPNLFFHTGLSTCGIWELGFGIWILKVEVEAAPKEEVSDVPASRVCLPISASGHVEVALSMSTTESSDIRCSEGDFDYRMTHLSHHTSSHYLSRASRLPGLRCQPALSVDVTPLAIPSVVLPRHLAFSRAQKNQDGPPVSVLSVNNLTLYKDL
jgi:hypothetical protein